MRNPNSDLENGLGVESVESAAELKLKQKLETLNPAQKSGLAELMQSLMIRNHGSDSLESVVNAMSENDVEDPFFVGNGKDGRMEAIAWIVSDDDGFIGRELTVEEAHNITKESL